VKTRGPIEVTAAQAALDAANAARDAALRSGDADAADHALRARLSAERWLVAAARRDALEDAAAECEREEYAGQARKSGALTFARRIRALAEYVLPRKQVA
jgi:hypothetical protein